MLIKVSGQLVIKDRYVLKSNNDTTTIKLSVSINSLKVNNLSHVVTINHNNTAYKSVEKANSVECC